MRPWWAPGAPTPYGRRACRELSLALAQRGVTIVSGMADGLDGGGPGRRGGRTAPPPSRSWATGIDKTYPAANAVLRADIERGGGAVLSEYPPHFRGKPQKTFLTRNRLIAAMGELLCVAEASARSGTMNTVGHARRYGRPVYAVPGKHVQRCQRRDQRPAADGAGPHGLPCGGPVPGNGACIRGQSVAKMTQGEVPGF